MEVPLHNSNIVILICLVVKCTICEISGTGPVFILEPPNSVTFLNSHGAIINCLVHGDPDPKITWITEANLKITSENIEILKNNSLVFLPFQIRSYNQNNHHVGYRCKASNKYGTIVSNIVKVKALVDQQYSTQVYDEYIIEGNTAVFKCHVPSYVKDFVDVTAWIRDDDLRITKSFENGSRYYITDNGNIHITKVNDQLDSGSNYKCETKHQISGKTTISEHGAKLHITELSSSIPPKIVDISTNVEVMEGETVILPCVSQAYPQPSYRWCKRQRKDNTCQNIDLNKQKMWKIIDDGSLLIQGRKNDSGTYICRASNELGQEEAVTKLTVFSPMSVFIHPQTQLVDIGDEVSIECVTSGGPIQSINYLKNGQLINQNGNNVSSAVLKISSVDVSSVGMYQCFVGNRIERKQASAQISLSAIPPKLKKKFHAQRVKPGALVTLQCKASGDPLPEIVWKIRDMIVNKTERIKIDIVLKNKDVLSTLSISEVKTLDGGLYTCEAVNKIAKISHSNLIQVYGQPFVWPVANKTAVTGDVVTIQCHVSGYPIKRISWFKDGKLLKTNRKLKIHENGSLVIFSANKQADDGEYTCEAESVDGLTTAAKGNINILQKPVIVPLLPTVIMNVKDRLHLMCAVLQGDPPIKFTWLFNGEPMPFDLDLTVSDAGFSSTLSGINVDRKHSGNYSCHAENTAGKASEITSVRVKGSPVWNKRPKSKYILTATTSTEIPCSGNGYPEPKSSWTTINGEKIHNLQESSRIIISDTGTLLIKQILEIDYVTTFVCSVSNDFSPDLTQEVRLSKLNLIKFMNLQNNFVSKASEEVVMKCQVAASGNTHINWQYGGKALIPSEDPRININNDDTTTGTISTLTIKETKLSDSGFYICKAHQRHLSNSTRFYLTVEGTVEDNKSNVFTNDSDVYYIKNESELSHENVTSSIFDNIHFYGVALLYIIPTVTAAIVLLVILIIVCVLLKGQRNKQHTSKMQDIEMKKSWRDHEQDFNTYGNRSNTSNKRRSLTKSSDTYYAMKQTKLQTDDNYHFYSEMPSASYHPDSSSITPYATFRSCTDPVPPIPNNAYPCSTTSSMKRQ